MDRKKNKKMTEQEALVREFHEVMDLPRDASFTEDLLLLRRRVIEEEVRELFEEIDKALQALKSGEKISDSNRTNMMKELADVLYASIGMGITFGLPMAEVFERVHESNMSKLGLDGKPIKRADGKVTKGPNYHPPYLDDLIS